MGKAKIVANLGTMKQAKQKVASLEARYPNAKFKITYSPVAGGRYTVFRLGDSYPSKAKKERYKTFDSERAAQRFARNKKTSRIESIYGGSYMVYYVE